MQNEKYTLHIEPGGTAHSWVWEIHSPEGHMVSWGARQGTEEEVTKYLEKPLARYNSYCMRGSGSGYRSAMV